MPISLELELAKKAKTLLSDKLPILYDELLKLYGDKLLTVISNSIQSNLDKHVMNDQEFTNFRRSYYRKKRSVYQLNSSRFKSYLENPKSVNLDKMKHIDVVKFYIKTMNEREYIIRTENIPPRKFNSYLLNKVKNQLNIMAEWSEDKSKPLVNYLFFGELKESDQKKWIQDDLENFVIDCTKNLLIEEWIKEIEIKSLEMENGSSSIENRDNLELPLTIATSSQITDRRSVVELNKELVTAQVMDEKELGEIGYAEGFVPKNVNINYFYPKESIFKDLGINSIEELNESQTLSAAGLRSEDYQVFMAISSFNTRTNFLEDKISNAPIRISVNQIREVLYPEQKYTVARDRERIVASILRLLNIGIGYRHAQFDQLPINSNSTAKTYFRIINAITISEGGDIGKDPFNIYLSPFIYDELVAKKTIKLFGEQVKELGGVELMFAFPLQLQRLSIYASRKFYDNLQHTENEFDDFFDNEYFRTYYNTKANKSKLIRIISNALTSLKDTNMVIQDFKYDVAKKGFFIKYTPVLDEEYNQYNKSYNDSNTNSLLDIIKVVSQRTKSISH